MTAILFSWCLPSITVPNLSAVAESFRKIGEAARAAALSVEEFAGAFRSARREWRLWKSARRNRARSCQTFRPGSRVPIGGRGATKRLREKKLRAAYGADA